MTAFPPAVSQNSTWIIGRFDDLVFFSGSAIFGYTLAIIGLTQGEIPPILVLLLALLIDGPHVYCTATRALFDPDERKRIGPTTWLMLLALCLLAPVVSWAFGFHTFFLLVAGWSHYHITKQHMGFVMLYRRKGNEREHLNVDKYFTLFALGMPFLFYLSAVLLGSTRLLPWFVIAAVLLTGCYIAFQSRLQRRNWPKLIVLIAFVPLTWFAWSYAAVEPYSPTRLLTAALTINIGHSLQYLRLMWFHNHNRYQDRSSMLGLISRRWIFFWAAVVVLAMPSFLIGQRALTWQAPFIMGFVMFHFVLDAKLWRIRGDAELARALRL
jgi:hypothetical protein